MGFDQQDFVKAFVSALNDESVINKLDSVICGHLNVDIGNLSEAQKKVQKDLEEFKDMNLQLQKEVAELRVIVQNKDARISDLELKTEFLESKLDEYEQYSRRNSLRITGIEESEDEDVQQKVLHLFSTRLQLDTPVTSDQVDRVHRTGRPKLGSHRPVLIKFATYGARQKVFKNRKYLKKQPEVQDASEVNGDQMGKKHQIFINEDLTKARSHLLWKARSYKRDKKINDCWTYDGRILIKDKKNKIIPITTISELSNIVFQ